MRVWSRPRSSRSSEAVTLRGSRVALRPLVPDDFAEWRKLRRVNRDWLTPWEPTRPAGPNIYEDRTSFAAHCEARQRERQYDMGYGFGVFVEDTLVGEMNIANVQRGSFQSCHVGYWIAQHVAGRGYTTEALVVALEFAFDELRLHRVQINIVPRNRASHRVVEKLGIRSEGVAERYLEINGQWEDHVRYGITREEWEQRGQDLLVAWTC